MAGLDLDPRTGQARPFQFSLRITILLLIMLAALCVLLWKLSHRTVPHEVSELAYRSTGLLKQAQWDYYSSHRSYGTLAELKKAGLIDWELNGDEALIDSGISARVSLPMDRMNYRIDVSYPGGSYMTTADDLYNFTDYMDEDRR